MSLGSQRLFVVAGSIMTDDVVTIRKTGTYASCGARATDKNASSLEKCHKRSNSVSHWPF